MFLIFALGREDVFSFGDLGLQKGFLKLYGHALSDSATPAQMIVQSWSPYRSYACLALWRSLDTSLE
jgi:DNA-3-methyladenine glycosylase II